MDLRPEEVVERKKIGSLDGEDVFQIRTCGGFNAVLKGGPDAELLGMGSHPRIALFIAQKKRPALKVTHLEKGSQEDAAVFERLLPYWEAVTADYASRLKGR